MPTCPAGHSSGATDYCDVCGARIAGPAGGAEQPAASPVPRAGTGGSGERCPDCSTPRTGRFCEDCGYDFAVGAARSPGAGQTGPGPAGPAGPAEPAGPAGGAAPATVSLPTRPPDPVTGPMRTRPPDPVTGPVRAAPERIGSPAPRADPGRRRKGNPPWTAVVIADRDYYETVLREAGDDPAAPPFAFPPYCPERRIPLTGGQIRIGRRSVSKGIVPEIDLGEPPEDPGASHTHAVLLARPDGSWVLVDPGSTNGTTINGGTDPIAVNVEVPLHEGDRIHVGVWTTIRLERG
jgi:FHA domain